MVRMLAKPRRSLNIETRSATCLIGAASQSPGQDPDTSAHTFIASTKQALGRNTNATSITSMHHRHRRPPPVQSFTPYPPIHLTDLSRPAARQPSHPGLPIPQLFPPRRRHRPHLRPVLLSSRHARFQSEPPWGHSYGYVNFATSTTLEFFFRQALRPRFAPPCGRHGPVHLHLQVGLPPPRSPSPPLPLPALATLVSQSDLPVLLSTYGCYPASPGHRGTLGIRAEFDA